MDLRRLVVWISAGILGFQGATLLLDLLNCTALSWLYVRRQELERGAAGLDAGAAGAIRPPDPSEQAERRPADPAAPLPLSATPQIAHSHPSSAAAPGAEFHDPVAVLCKRPHARIDAGVSQGLSILAGLALGGSVGGGGRGESP